MVRREGASFDGAWVVRSVAACNGAILATQTTISKGRVISGGAVIGSVTAAGVIHTQFHAEGVTVNGNGHLSGGRGSGAYRRSDGCAGTWTATRM